MYNSHSFGHGKEPGNKKQRSLLLNVRKTGIRNFVSDRTLKAKRETSKILNNVKKSFFSLMLGLNQTEISSLQLLPLVTACKHSYVR